MKETIEDDCSGWCTAGLYIVPAKVAGVWQFEDGELALTQKYQMVSGEITQHGKTAPLVQGRMKGRGITFSVADLSYTGEVNGSRIVGTVTRAAGGASRAGPRPKPGRLSRLPRKRRQSDFAASLPGHPVCG